MEVKEFIKDYTLDAKGKLVIKFEDLIFAEFENVDTAEEAEMLIYIENKKITKFYYSSDNKRYWALRLTSELKEITEEEIISIEELMRSDIAELLRMNEIIDEVKESVRVLSMRDKINEIIESSLNKFLKNKNKD